MVDRQVAVIGGGAAGFFAAIACAEQNPQRSVHILEGTRRTLTKVRISGGGRCNVTHACFEPRALVKNYPRGHRELLGPFHRFQPEDTVKWFAERGVSLKRELDGRIFPVSDRSETIAGCLEQAAQKAGVQVHLGAIVKRISLESGHFIVSLRERDQKFANVILATGGSPGGHALAQSLGHQLIPPVPSLFTFNVEDPRLHDQAGISFPHSTISLSTDGSESFAYKQTGPLLITHWGLSGPAVLKLSAWAARELHASSYRANLKINFMADESFATAYAALLRFKDQHPKKMLSSDPALPVPRRYWQQMVHGLLDSRSKSTLIWADASRDILNALAREICDADFDMTGKGVFKDEFVSAGGVPLNEVDFRTMASLRCPGLYFAGEILDVDGITGGFNFQNAWTTGWTAGKLAS